jgi:beta-N-acetylhexosaminidase
MRKIIILSLTFFIIWVFTPHIPGTENPSQQPRNEDYIVFSLSGKVLQIENNLLTIQTEDKAFYFFDPSSARVLSSVMPQKGDWVTLRYVGHLLEKQISPKATLLSIEVFPPPAPETPVPLPYPKKWDDKGIFSASYLKAYEKLQSMSLAEKAGQIFLARCPSQNPRQIIESFHPGGFVLFATDFSDKTKDEVINTLSSYQRTASVPMLLAVDEEGGTVVRVSKNSNLAETPFLSPQALYRFDGMDAIYQDAVLKSQLLLSLGLNVNLAPVCDVSVSSYDYIYPRTFGKSAEETANYISTVVQAMEEQNFSSVLKHFPGYGNNSDTHTGIAIDNRSYDTFQKEDFLPFHAGIEAGAPAILVAHTIVNCIDDSTPASLSLPVHQVLRETLSYTGIIITDDLSMDAISKYTKEESPALTALKAGNDLIIVTDLNNAYHSVLSAAEDGSLPEELLDRAVFRILAWKYQKGILK